MERGEKKTKGECEFKERGKREEDWGSGKGRREDKRGKNMMMNEKVDD